MATRPWLPTDATTGVLEGWYFLKDATGTLSPGAKVTQSGGVASQWADASAKNRPLTTSGSSQPAYVANGLGTGYPALTFNGSQYLKYLAGGYPTGPFNVFMAGYLNSANVSAKRIVSIGPSSGGNDNFNGGLYLLLARGGASYSSSQNDTDGTASTLTAGTPGLLESIAPSTTTTGTRANGGATTTTNTVSNTTVQNCIALFSNITATGDCGQGACSELILVSGVLSAADLANYEGYTAWNNGTQGALPANHPYKAAAPTVDTGGAGTAYSLTAAVATFAVAGISAARQVSRSSALTAFSLAGVSTGRRVSRGSVAGAFALNGKAAARLLSRGSATASFSLVGQPAGLNATTAGPQARTLVAAASAFTVSGKSAARVITRSATAGSFTLSGYASGRLLSRSAVPAAFVLFGQPAALTYAVHSFKLLGAPAAFAVSGKAATFVRTVPIGYVLTGAARSIVLVGNAVQFRVQGKARLLRQPARSGFSLVRSADRISPGLQRI